MACRGRRRWAAVPLPCHTQSSSLGALPGPRQSGCRLIRLAAWWKESSSAGYGDVRVGRPNSLASPVGTASGWIIRSGGVAVGLVEAEVAGCDFREGCFLPCALAYELRFLVRCEAGYGAVLGLFQGGGAGEFIDPDGAPAAFDHGPDYGG